MLIIALKSRSNKFKTPLMFASANTKDPKIIEYLLQHDPHINAKLSNGVGSVGMVVVQNNIPAIKILLKHGAKPSENTLTFIDTICDNDKVIELFDDYP